MRRVTALAGSSPARASVALAMNMGARMLAALEEIRKVHVIITQKRLRRPSGQKYGRMIVASSASPMLFAPPTAMPSAASSAVGPVEGTSLPKWQTRPSSTPSKAEKSAPRTTTAAKSGSVRHLPAEAAAQAHALVPRARKERRQT